MQNSSSKKTLVVVIILVIILVAIFLLIKKAPDNTNQLPATNNATSSDVSSTQTAPNTPLEQMKASGSTDSALASDMSVIDTEIGGLNSDSNSVNQ